MEDRLAPQNLQMDKIAQVPTLVDITCDFLAENIYLIFETCTSEVICNASSSVGAEMLLRRNVVLPCGLSEKLVQSTRRHYLKNDQSDLFMLRALAKAPPGATVLENVNLTDSCVTDDVLCRLLSLHRRELRSLNLKGCEHLSRDVHPQLVSRLFHLLPKLTSLNLGDLLYVFKDWLLPADQNDFTSSANEDSKEPDDNPVPSTSTTNIFQKLEKQLFSSLSRAARFAEKDSSVENRRGGKVAKNGSNNVVDESPSVSYTNDAGALRGTGDANSAICNTDEFMQIEENFSTDADDVAPELELTQSTLHDQQPNTLFSSFSISDAPIITDICPNLTKLILHGSRLSEIFNETEDVVDKECVVWEFFQRLLRPVAQLKILDISSWTHTGDLSFLDGLKLSTLVLYDVPNLYKAVGILCSMDTLESLDVSQSNSETGQYLQPVATLSRIVSSLPKLRHLDISFTNLASNPVKGDPPRPPESGIESDIYGLQGLKQKLDYLGLFGCDTAAYYRRIPAHRVTGEANEPQMLLALEQYMRRPTVILSVLNEIFQVYRFNAAADYVRAMHLMLDTMEIYKHNVNVQIASSASLFYIMRNINMTSATKNRTVRLLLDVARFGDPGLWKLHPVVRSSLFSAIDIHHSEQTLIRNCCLSMCQFEIAQDMSHVYLGTFRILIRVLQEFNELTIHRLVVHILNTLACAGQNDQKVTVGEMGAITVMLELIRRRLEAENCDEVMETAWSFLWNITDETPANCRLFLTSQGMELFQLCYVTFPNKHGLMRNMMGLIGNIAEVRELRNKLMSPTCIQIFCELLRNLSEGIEISYNSAGVLAHMLSDDISDWTVGQPSRQKVSDDVIQAAKTWQINSKRYINYRSFEPIIRLLHAFHSPASQYWAAWALANLTTVDEGCKYSKFVVDENGLTILNRIVLEETETLSDRDPSFFEVVKIVLENVSNYFQKAAMTASGLDKTECCCQRSSPN